MTHIFRYTSHIFFEFEGVYYRLTSARGARNNEIEKHRVCSCQTPQIPGVREKERERETERAKEREIEQQKTRSEGARE